MNRSLMAMVAATAFVAALPAYAAETAQTFVDKAAAGGLFEIQSSELALKMSKSGEIKSFAQMMVQDHGKANAALETVAKKEGLKVPVALDKEHAAKIQTLQSAGSQFDPPYVKAQLEGHQETVELFEEYAANGDNAAIQSFANETLPTLKAHLEKIKAISDQLGTQ
jgi:putative membrane protein